MKRKVSIAIAILALGIASLLVAYYGLPWIQQLLKDDTTLALRADECKLIAAVLNEHQPSDENWTDILHSQCPFFGTEGDRFYSIYLLPPSACGKASNADLVGCSSELSDRKGKMTGYFLFQKSSSGVEIDFRKKGDPKGNPITVLKDKGAKEFIVLTKEYWSRSRGKTNKNEVEQKDGPNGQP